MIGIVAVISGGAIIVTTKNIALGAIVILVGGLLSVVGVVLSAGKNKKKTDGNSTDNSAYEQLLDEIAKDEDFIKSVEQGCIEMFDKLGMQYNEYDAPAELSRIRGLIKDYDELADRWQKGESPEREEEIKDLTISIAGFLGNYRQDVQSDYQKALYQLRSDVSDYSRLKDKMDKMQKASKERDDVGNEVKNYIISMGFEPEENLKDQLSLMNEKIISLNYSKDALKNSTERKEAFERDNDVTKFIDIDYTAETASLEELNGSFNKLKLEIAEVEDLEDSFRDQLGTTAQELETIESDEAELEELQEEYAADMRKYQIIAKTKEYLEKAKQNFSGKYMDDIKKSFEKYHNIISNSDEKYELDANLNIKLKEKGSLHELGVLSEGYKDLVGLCRRIAMVDAMYDMEKTFLIFDDPFVNLDESRLSGAVKFLDDLSKEYQIVYFSCHKSRC